MPKREFHDIREEQSLKRTAAIHRINDQYISELVWNKKKGLVYF